MWSFDEICCNKLDMLLSEGNECAEEILILGRAFSIQIYVEWANGNNYQWFFNSSREIFEHMSYSNKVLQRLPGIKMNIATVQWHQCTPVPDHFTVLPTLFASNDGTKWPNHSVKFSWKVLDVNISGKMLLPFFVQFVMYSCPGTKIVL